MQTRNLHVLRNLLLPDRFESLYERVGSEIARVLVKPEKPTTEAFEKAALAINARGEGLFVPLYGQSGTGKTTLASSLSTFFPSSFAPTMSYIGKVTYDDLQDAVSEAVEQLPADDRRIISLNLDHRESDPPNAKEYAAIKRFLRRPSQGARCIVLWPETSSDIAQEIAQEFTSIAGQAPIDLPLTVEGPPRKAWVEIATNTLEISNRVSSIADLGVDPKNYDPAKYKTIGEFLRVISSDFTNHLYQLIASTKEPLSLIIVFASSSSDPGVLSQLTNPSHYGLLDGHALLGATSKSEIGRWWDQHRGLLTQTILQLNARVFCLPPAASIAALRNFGLKETQNRLEQFGIRRLGPKMTVRTIGRTDLGRFLIGTPPSAFESRGTPAEKSTPAFKELAREEGFTYGRDKRLNNTLRDALSEYLRQMEVPFVRITNETKLDFCGLIPDNAIHLTDQIMCMEYSWRSVDYLTSRHRSEIAQYILKKLRSYARELGWTSQ